MPHLVVLYSDNLDARTDMTSLCRRLGDAMLAQVGSDGRALFPLHGTRVFAYPARHFAVADGAEDAAFIYLKLSMSAGRPPELVRQVGDALLAAASLHLDAAFAEPLGLTLHIDEIAPAFEGKRNSIPPR